MRYLDVLDSGQEGVSASVMLPTYASPNWVTVDLSPGDVLLYDGPGLPDALIRLKTWGWASHCELYDREGASLASRPAAGVNRYAVRTHGLVAVLSPRWPSGHAESAILWQLRNWFDGVRGQPYDWVGLLAFFIRQRQGSSNPSMFCSELVARAFKKGGFPLLEGDCDAVSPWDFWKSPQLKLQLASPDLPPRDRM